MNKYASVMTVACVLPIFTAGSGSASAAELVCNDKSSDRECYEARTQPSGHSPCAV